MSAVELPKIAEAPRGRGLRKDEQAIKRSQYMALRRQGYTYEQIGEQFGVTSQAVYVVIRGEMARMAATMREDAEFLRDVMHQRHEALIRRLWEHAVPARGTKPDMTAVEKILRAINQDAMLMGYAAPQRHQVDVQGMQRAMGIVVDVVQRFVPEDQTEAVLHAVREAITMISQRAELAAPTTEASFEAVEPAAAEEKAGQ